MTREYEEKRNWIPFATIIAAGVFFAAALLIFRGQTQRYVLIAAYFLAGWPVMIEAVETIFHGEIFDENFLMTVASAGALFVGEIAEAVAVMLLYQIGEWLQDKAVDTSRHSIQALIAIRPDQAMLLNGEEVNAADVAVGTQIRVRPGDRIPLDGVVHEGSAAVDTAALTGESFPRQWSAGDTALSGCVVLDGVLIIEVTKPYADSTVSRILAMVEDAQENKAQSEQFIARFARVYTPVVCAIAVLLAIIPPILRVGTWAHFLHKALAFLVISCPCALVISVPLTFFSGIGCASRCGILLKGGNYLEQLAKVKVAAFDKTGTLTQGRFQVTEILPKNGLDSETLLEIAAYVESQSSHPLAKAIVSRYGRPVDIARVREVREVSGKGIRAIFDGMTVLVGKPDFVGIDDSSATEDTEVYLAADGRFLGCIVLEDTLKPDTKLAISQLRDLGLSHLTMLSGDRRDTAEKFSAEIGLDQVYAELLPEDKVRKLTELKQYGSVLYAGDGINDAPVLACADVGIAMGGLGSDAAMEASDIVITSDEPSRIPQSIRIARNTMRIAKENIALSIFVKCIILTASMLGDIQLWLAVFADVGVCLLTIFNSLRAMYDRG